MIPDEAVQAAHAAICEQNLDECLDPDWRGKCVKAVEAAAPQMLAKSLEEAADAIEAKRIVPELDRHYVAYLYDRADKIREGTK